MLLVLVTPDGCALDVGSVDVGSCKATDTDVDKRVADAFDGSDDIGLDVLLETIVETIAPCVAVVTVVKERRGCCSVEYEVWDTCVSLKVPR